jgi:myosin-5
MARPTSFSSVVRGEKIRKEFAELRRRHKAAATIQSQVKSKIARIQYKGIADASVVIQSAIRGWLVRRCSGDIGWLKSGGAKVK